MNDQTQYHLLEKWIGYLSITNGAQFAGFLLIYLFVIDVTKVYLINFTSTVPWYLSILLTIILLVDYIVSIFVIYLLAKNTEKYQSIVKIFGLLFALLSLYARINVIFSVLFPYVTQIGFTWIYTIAPLSSVSFGIILLIISYTNLSFTNRRGLLLLAVINLLFSIPMAIFGFYNYVITPLDLQLWNQIVLAYAFKVTLLPLISAFVFDSWSSSIKKYREYLNEQNVDSNKE